MSLAGLSEGTAAAAPRVDIRRDGGRLVHVPGAEVDGPVEAAVAARQGDLRRSDVDTEGGALVGDLEHARVVDVGGEADV